MNLKELQDRLKSLLTEARDLQATAGRTSEQEARLDECIVEAKKAQADIERVKSIGALDEWAGASGRTMLGLADPNVAPEAAKGAPAAGDAPAFKSFGEFLKAVVDHEVTRGQKTDARLSTKAATGANESVSSDGGFLVQTDFTAEILRRSYETGQIISRVRRIPISANANGLKINAVDETSRASGSRWGGVQTYWINEADTITASRPRFRQMELSLKKLAGAFYATDELLQDQSALEAVASQAFADEFAYKLDEAVLRGTGAGQPLGILNANSLVTISKETSQAAATLQAENIIKMWARCWGRSRLGAIWLINQDIEPELFTMNLPIGTGGVSVYLPPGGLSQAPYGTLFGRPVIPIEQASTLGTTGDIILADFSQYLMIEKGGLNSAASMHVRFLQDEMVFKFTLRVDGQPIWSSALTPANGSNTLSPFVTLETRS